MKNLEKEILSFNEAITYLDVSKSSLYKMTSESRITFFKPNNGKIYFRKKDLENWMTKNEQRSVEKLMDELNHKIYSNGQ